MSNPTKLTSNDRRHVTRWIAIGGYKEVYYSTHSVWLIQSDMFDPTCRHRCHSDRQASDRQKTTTTWKSQKSPTQKTCTCEPTKCTFTRTDWRCTTHGRSLVSINEGIVLVTYLTPEVRLDVIGPPTVVGDTCIVIYITCVITNNFAIYYFILPLIHKAALSAWS